MAKKYTFGLNNASEPQGKGEESPSPASVSTGKKYTFGLNDYKPNTKGISFEENAQAREEFEKSLNPAQPLNIANRHLFEEGELTPALPSPTALTGQSQSPEISSPRIPQLIPAHEQFQPQERSFLQNLIEGAQAGYYKSAPVKGNNEIDQTMANLMPQSKMLREKAERGKQNIELAKDYESQGVGGWLGGMAADLPYWITGEGLVNAGLKTAAPKLAPIAEKVSGAGWGALQKLAQSNPKAALNIAYSIEKASPYVARAMKDALIGAVVGPIEAIGTGEPEKAGQMAKEYAEFGALLGPVFHGVGQVFKGVKNGIKPELPTPEQKLADFQLPRAAQIETPPEPKTFGQRWLDMQKAAENPVKPEINPVESIAEPPRVNIPEEQINPAEGQIKPNTEYYTNGFNQLKETFKNQIDQGEIHPNDAKEILDSIVGEMKTEAKVNGVELPNLDYSDIMPKPKENPLKFGDATTLERQPDGTFKRQSIPEFEYNDNEYYLQGSFENGTLSINKAYKNPASKQKGQMGNLIDDVIAEAKKQGIEVNEITAEGSEAFVKAVKKHYGDKLHVGEVISPNGERDIRIDLKPTYEEASQRAHDLVAEHIKWLDDTHGQGVEPGGMSFDENGNVSQRWGRESKNELWYGDFYKEHGRKPNKEEKIRIAIDHLRNGTDSTLGKIPANEEFLALEKRLEELKPKEAQKPEPKKELWQMTKEQAKGTYPTELAWDNIGHIQHKNAVIDALMNSKEVPENVLSEYPDVPQIAKERLQDIEETKANQAKAQQVKNQIEQQKAQEKANREAELKAQNETEAKVREETLQNSLENAYLQTKSEYVGKTRGPAKGLREYDHEQSVKKALAEGKEVPAEVLKDYPDLQPKAEQPKTIREKVAEKAEQPKTFDETLKEFSQKEEPVGAKAGVKTLTEKLDAVETAAKDRIKSRQGRVMSGIPADQIADYAVVGATKLAKGIIKYSEWSAEMIKEFGEAIKPQLKEIYNKAVAIRTHQETPQQKLDPNLKLIFGSKSAENAPIERRSFPDTVANGEITDPELKAKLGETVFNYEVKPNQVTLDNAKDFIAQDKEAAKRLVLDEEAPATAETNAMAQLLIKEANDSGNWEDAIKLIEVTAKKATEQGQAIQALSMWGRLTPEGALRHAKNLYEKAKTPEQARGLKEVNDKLGEEIGDINKKAADQIGDELQNDLEGIVKRIKRTTSTGNQLELFPEVKPGKYEGKPGRFERNPEAEQKPKIQQKKEETPAEQLAKRVKNAVKEDSENQVERDAVKTMVNTLFRVAKEALPEKDLRRTKPLDFVVEAIKDRANYRKVWVEARKIVREKFADDPEKLEILEDYFAKGINRTFDQKRLNSAVDEGLKELGIKVSNIVKEHYSLNTKARNDLIQKLVTEAGLSGEEAQILAKHIYNRMKDLTKANKERALRNIFGVRAAMTKRSLSDRIIELSNLGAFQNENYRGLVAQKFNLPELDEATYKSIYKQAQRIQTLEDGRAKDVAIAKMLDTIASKIPPTMLDKLGTIQTIAQLLNPKTLGRNIIGNAGFLGLDNFTQAMAVPMDKAFSKLTGKREIAMPNFSRQKQGFKEGWKLGLEDALLGIDTSGLQSQYQLRKNLTFRAEQAGWDNKILGPLEKALSVGLRATDRAFYNATFFDTLHGLMSVKGVTEPTEEMIKTAQYEGLRRTFQDESVLANLFVGLKDVLNLNTQKLITKRGGKRLGFGAGDFLIKYPKTPANLLQRGIEYSPLGFGRVLWEAGRPLTGIGKQFNQREFSLAFTRALTGSGALVGTGFMLGKLGIVTGKPPGDYDTAQLKRDTGFGEYRINLSALKRYTHDGGLVDFLKLGMKQQAAKTTEQKAEVEKLKRELVKKYEPQPGDVTMSYDWFQPNAINMAIGADIAETKGASDLLGMFVNALSTGINAYAEQPVIKGFSTLFGQKDKTEGFKKVLAGVPASFAPTLFNQVGQLLSNQKRITTSDEYLQGMGNQFKKKIPGLNQTLPKDYTQLGEEAKTYQEGSFLTDNNPINVFLNPAFVNIYNPSKEAKLALDIYYSTGETAQMPKRLENNFTVDKEKFTMTSEELSEMKKFVGQKVKEGYSNIDLDEEDMGSTVKKMTDVLEKSWFEGKKMILDKRNVKYSTKGKSTTIKLDKN